MRLNYEKFLKSGDHADVEFVVKPEKFDISKTFKAHKLLLALSSEVFEAMFYGQLAEKDTVVITDLHPDGFYGLLKYVYAGEARIENCYEALHTKAAAEKYLFEDLATSCLAYLRKQVDYKEACLVLDYGFESGYGSLDKVAEAVLFNKGDVCTRDFHNSGGAKVGAVTLQGCCHGLQDDHFRVPAEAEVLDAVIVGIRGVHHF